MNLNYSSTNFEKTIPASDYIAQFRDPQTFEQCCRECHNYGRIWACPPFHTDLVAQLQRYPNVTLYVTKIEPECRDLPVSATVDLVREERLKMERKLLDLEQSTQGCAMAYAGRCLHCPEGTCTRLQGNPCRHPELVRPSLESVGFDIGRTTAEIFGMELLWGREGKLPPYLLLVTALFH